MVNSLNNELWLLQGIQYFRYHTIFRKIENHKHFSFLTAI